MALQWQVWNNGSLNAIGYKCDTAYLSENSIWDITDHQLGTSVCTFISIPPAGQGDMPPRGSIYSTIRSAPFVAQKNYSCILRTRSNIRDPNLSNNIGVSMTPLRINAPTLILGVPTNISIASGDELVYKIENVPSESTLIATLIASENSGFHDLFLRYRDPPTRSNYDAFSQYSLSHNQTAVIQSTKLGLYYIRIENFGTDTDPYQVQVEVKLAIFEITNVNPVSAAPLGNVTLHLSGTLISNDVEAALINEASSDMITAYSVYWFSSVELYATFDIRNISTGMYSIQLTNTMTNELAQLRNRFEISSGIPGQVSMRLDAPPNLLRGESTIVTLFVQNTGNTDIRTPLMFIRSNRNLQISVVRSGGETADNYATEIVFLPVPSQGPSGVIPPGVTTKTLFRVLPQSFRSSFSEFLSVSFLDESQMDYAHSYTDRKQELQPRDIPNDSWDIIWNNFMSSVGETWRTMTERFSDITSRQSLGRRIIGSVDELVELQLRIAQGGLGPLGESNYGICCRFFCNFKLSIQDQT